MGRACSHAVGTSDGFVLKETVDWPGKIQKEMDHAASMLELAKSRMTLKLDQDIETFNQNTRQVITLVKNLRREASLVQPKVVELKTRCHELRTLLNAAIQEAEVINLQQQRLEVTQTDLKGPVYEAGLELDPFQRLWDTVADYQSQCVGCCVGRVALAWSPAAHVPHTPWPALSHAGITCGTGRRSRPTTRGRPTRTRT